MKQTILITVFALAIDFLVCFSFGLRLYFLKKEGKSGQLLTNFTYFFMLFAAFILITPLYLPGVVFTNPTIMKIAFMIDFAVLMTISVLILNIISISRKENKENILVPVWSMISALIWVYMLIKLDPVKKTTVKWAFWGFTPTLLVSAAFFACAPFIIAAAVFFTKSVTETGSRLRFFLLAVGFLLIVVGGPLHQFAQVNNFYLLADFVTTLGFFALFLALVLKSEAAVKV